MANITTPDYAIDYEDERLQNIETEKTEAQNNINNTYGNMIANSDQYYDDLKQSTQEWADKQSQLQQERTDFTIEQIEQEKEQANKDYVKEQSGAYVDWQKQSNAYGTEAEKMAASGLANSGFSESSQVSMYNTYQNRVATARESYNKAVLNYNNAIKDAQLQNNAALAEIAYNALQQQLELSLQGFQYKNQLLENQVDKTLQVDEMYWNKYTDILNQINTENALAEDVRQFNTGLEFEAEENQKDRDLTISENEKERAHDKVMAEIEHKYQLQRDEINNNFTAKQAELDRKHDLALVEANTKAAKEKANYEYQLEMKKLKQQHQNDLALVEANLEAEKKLYSYKSSVDNSSSGNKKITGDTTLGEYISGEQGTVNISTYSDAVKYMTSNGVPKSTASSIMTANEWSRRRNSYKSTGKGSDAVALCSSYQEYLSYVVQYYTSKE